jgi:fatty acid desaturase
MPELTAQQKRHLKRWERRMRLTGAVIGTIFFMFLAFGWLTENVPTVIYVYLALFSVAMLWGAHVRFTERCPNCGQRIGSWFGMQTYFGLPRNCKQCGVSFE